MDALLLVLSVGGALLIAYFTYGRWVAGRVFQLRKDTATPATVLCDDRDFCPTPKTIVFGHHFTSIAGTGPIVGPAIAVMWGWLPAVLWVVFGSVFIGAVHDLGAIVVSMRNKGRSVGDIAGDLLGPRVRLIFLAVLVMALWVVLAIFGLVIASVMRRYPVSIFPVLVQIPLAVVIGVMVHRRGRNILGVSLLALALMYASVIWGDAGPLHAFNMALASAPMWLWVVGLLAYAYAASVLPVWTLLQPRDYINSLQLISALGLLVAGLVVAATIGGAPEQRLEREQEISVAPIANQASGLAPGPSGSNRSDAENAETSKARGLSHDAGPEGVTTREGPDQRPPRDDTASSGSPSDEETTGATSSAESNHANASADMPPDAGSPPDRPKLELVAPMVQWRPEGAPPLLPVLFITIACGAVSGFHCLVGSGTTSKQISNESHARMIGYGSMLTEAFLATLVIAACAAGIGLGISKAFSSSRMRYGSWTMKELHIDSRSGDRFQIQRTQGPVGGVSVDAGSAPITSMLGVFLLDPDHDPRLSSVGMWPDGKPMAQTGQLGDLRTAEQVGLRRYEEPGWITVGDSAVNGFIDDQLHIRGALAWDAQYQSWSSAQGLASTVGAFVEGAANLIKSMGVSASIAVALMGVLVASFAGTTMDTACRLQRYVIQELARTFLPRPTTTSCRTCGYEMSGHMAPYAVSEAAPANEGPGLNRTNQPASHESSPRSDRAPETVTCPECGERNDLAKLMSGAAPSLQAGIQLASPMNPCRLLATTHGATLFAVISAAILAGMPTPGQPWTLANFGQGGLILWPLFGATNQLLGGLSFLVIGAWLIATKRPWWFMALPAAFMLIIPAWALIWQAFIGDAGNPSWIMSGQWALVAVGALTLALEVWLLIEVLARVLPAPRTSSSHAAASDSATIAE